MSDFCVYSGRPNGPSQAAHAVEWSAVRNNLRNCGICGSVIYYRFDATAVVSDARPLEHGPRIKVSIFAIVR